MELKKCPDCKQLYSVSYRRCPFCEEEQQLNKPTKKRGGRRVSEKKPVHSARGAMILILIFVLLVLSWYLFGDLLVKPEEPDTPTPPVEDPVDPVDPVSPEAPTVDPDEPTEPDEPVEPDTPSLSKDDLSLRSIYGPVAKATADEDADYDLSMSLNDGTIQLSVNGTDESVAWGSENESIVVVDGTGTLKFKARGKAIVTATVGGVTLRCIVRIN